MSVPRVDDDFFTDHGVDKDQIWFPYTNEERAWYTEVDGRCSTSCKLR
jgi:hypothetical protein